MQQGVWAGMGPADEQLRRWDEAAMDRIAPQLAAVENVKEQNQLRMLHAFTSCRVAAHHLQGSTGYGYNDAGREKLEQVFATVFGCEGALVRHQFMSGTHALAVALFGVLRPGDTLLCASGLPYDTLHGVIGLPGTHSEGNLADFGVAYCQIELTEQGALDINAIRQQAGGAKVLYLQRSRGYAQRPALTPADIKAAAAAAKEENPGIVVMVDNCYGEFCRAEEPTHWGADLAVGSLIKNPGGGIAPTGGYIAGRENLVERCAQRMSAPGVGGEVGSTGEMLRQLYLGLYFAPAVTAEALKSALYAAALFEALGWPVSPAPECERDDIITSVNTGSGARLKALCRGIQQNSPVDSHLTPEPWPMPGYDSEVIMAAGAFTQGSSIELSCDGPMRPPYTAYLQGGLNFAASRAALLHAAAAALAEG